MSRIYAAIALIAILGAAGSGIYFKGRMDGDQSVRSEMYAAKAKKEVQLYKLRRQNREELATLQAEIKAQREKDDATIQRLLTTVAAFKKWWTTRVHPCARAYAFKLHLDSACGRMFDQPGKHSDPAPAKPKIKTGEWRSGKEPADDDRREGRGQSTETRVAQGAGRL